MSLYIVTRKSDGAEVYRYEYDQPLEQPGWEFDTHDHTLFVPPPPPAPPPPPPRHITKLAFRNRFTRAEKVALELAALDNPAASSSQRQMAAALRADMEDQAQALYIDLDRADTRAGVQTLEAAGLLAAGRALSVLDAPVQEHEVYRG
jgi:hypothetical protein